VARDCIDPTGRGTLLDDLDEGVVHLANRIGVPGFVAAFAVSAILRIVRSRSI